MTRIEYAKFLVVFVFAGVALTQNWVEQAILTASNKAVRDCFGCSLSLTDNYALVGASGLDNFAGNALIFVRSGTTWTEQAILTASNPGMYHSFGTSVSLTDNHALIGASGADPGSLKAAGAAYVFARSGTRWTEQAILTASNKVAGDWFGFSVSLTESHASIGAHYARPGSIVGAGASYIFVRSGIYWYQVAILTASNKAAYDNFGWAVSMTDNYALVSAYLANPGGLSDAGAAYVFVRSGSTWTEQAILTASNKASGDWFGRSVSLTDNYALIGGSNTARCYIFERSGSVWIQTQILSYSANTKAVAINHNFAMVNNNIFSRSGNSWSLQTTLGRNVKGSVALTETYAIIGDPYANAGGIEYAGEAYVFLNTAASQKDKESTIGEDYFPVIARQY